MSVLASVAEKVVLVIIAHTVGGNKIQPVAEALISPHNYASGHCAVTVLCHPCHPSDSLAVTGLLGNAMRLSDKPCCKHLWKHYYIAGWQGGDKAFYPIPVLCHHTPGNVILHHCHLCLAYIVHIPFPLHQHPAQTWANAYILNI